jgi:hypothetical protein
MTFQLPAQLVTIWDKFTAWVGGEAHAAAVVFSAEEQAVLAAFAPILRAAEGVTLATLISFIRNALSASATAKDLPTWEAEILNALEAEGGQLFTIAKGLGSNLLQALIAVLLASVPKPAA